MQAGLLRERIEILRPRHSQSDTGDSRVAYESLGSVRAEVIAQNSKKALVRGEELYPMTRVFRLRIPPLVEGGDRIVYRGIAYEALPPVLSLSDKTQTVTCEQVNE